MLPSEGDFDNLLTPEFIAAAPRFSRRNISCYYGNNMTYIAVDVLFRIGPRGRVKSANAAILMT